ncbi:MAG: hypothetical protein Q4G70_06130 [Pseudomonadota bacterium]|nr:hypothetical protein [Pseudomonadota bacterium]
MTFSTSSRPRPGSRSILFFVVFMLLVGLGGCGNNDSTGPEASTPKLRCAP